MAGKYTAVNSARVFQKEVGLCSRLPWRTPRTTVAAARTQTPTLTKISTKIMNWRKMGTMGQGTAQGQRRGARSRPLPPPTCLCAFESGRCWRTKPRVQPSGVWTWAPRHLLLATETPTWRRQGACTLRTHCVFGTLWVAVVSVLTR
jgi:hypothetical protein